MTINHSRWVGFTSFKNATLKEICDYFLGLSQESNRFVQWAEEQTKTVNDVVLPWAKTDAMRFLQNAASQFTYYRDELARLSSEMSELIEDRHLIAIRTVWGEASDFDETCIRFKNHVVFQTNEDTHDILIEIYAGARDRNGLFLDLINTLPRIGLLRPETPSNAEILSLKPEFYGISLDLKLFLLKMRHWFRSTFSKKRANKTLQRTPHTARRR